jgi:hypothetical protein
MLDWIRQLFGGRSRTLRDDQISTNQAVYAAGGADEDRWQGESSGSDDSGGSDAGGSGSGGGDSGGGGGNGGGS